jgi:hypothetical protein
MARIRSLLLALVASAVASLAIGACWRANGVGRAVVAADESDRRVPRDAGSAEDLSRQGSGSTAETEAVESSSTAGRSTSDGPCTIPSGVEVVLRAERTIVPHGGPARREGVEVVAGGACSLPVGSIECVRLPNATLSRLVVAVRAAASVRHQSGATSPHYGSRSISARWDGGRCEVADASTEPVLPDDQPIFDAAYAAIVDAAIAARGDAGVP